MGDDSAQRLFDEYLDLALAGRVPQPHAFVAGRADGDADLLERLLAIQALVASDPVELRPAAALADADLPFERLGVFRLLRELGGGGMGRVFLAEQDPLGRLVALKVVRSEQAGRATAEGRFLREARALAAVRHPGVVGVLGFGDDQGVRYLAMPLVPGCGLDELLAGHAARGEAMPVADATRWALTLARALAAVHAEGLLHRDVKPSNVRVTPEGEAVLVDFGLARDADAPRLTLSGDFAGSPAYASPEQVRGDEALDGRTDVYSLGLTLHQVLTGWTPFPSASVATVLHRVLTEEPPPPRSLRPSLPRDLELVVRRAIEKDRAHRYPSMEAFADDLQAVLELRPIEARPPGAWRRLVHWARRSPATAGGLAAACAVALVAAGLWVAAGARERAQRLAQIDDALQRADARVAAYDQDVAAEGREEARLAGLQRDLAYGYVEPARVREALLAESALAAARQRRASLEHEVLELLRHAERLGADAPALDAVRGRLYLAVLRDAVESKRPIAADYDERLAEVDPTGSLRGLAYPATEVRLLSDPPGAEVHLFRYVEHSQLDPAGDPRLVPVPLHGEGPLRPGSFCLRVLADGGDLRAGDLIVALDGVGFADAAEALVALARAERGGALARVVRGDASLELPLPPALALALRATGAPAPRCTAARAGNTPLDVRLPSGSYLAVLSADGALTQRVVVRSRGRDRSELLVPLVAAGQLPAGLPVVVDTRAATPVPFAVMDREVTAAEWLRFLDDPAIRARIDASEAPVLFPRDRGNALTGGWWPRGTDGRYALPDDWRPDWPVVGVSFDDARDYAAWLTARDRAEGARWTWRLPTIDERAAFCGGNTRRYSYGDRYHPHWSNVCYSRPEAGLEPVLSSPLDETPLGVYDTCGNALEWTDALWDTARGLMHAAGGAWGQTNPELLGCNGGFGLEPDQSTGETGLRLVCAPDEVGR